MHILKKALLIIALLATTLMNVQAASFDQRIPMRVTKASTFYVGGYLDGFGAVDMMVDSGSSYTSINEAALAVLKENGAVTYVKDLSGTLADGTHKTVPVYRISKMSIGRACSLRNVEVAVFPGHTRYILGLSALKMTAPFAFSLDPATLLLSNCPESAAIPGNDLSLNAE